MVRIGPRVPVVTGVDSTPSSGSAPTGGNTLSGGVTPSTTAADRARLSSGVSRPTGSNIAAAMLSNASFSLRTRGLLDEAVAHAAPGDAADVALAISTLAGRPNGEKTALKQITSANGGPKPAPLPPAEAARALAVWLRRELTSNALAGHHDRLAKLLLEPIATEPDAERRNAALAAVEALSQKGSGSYELAAILRGAGALPDTHDWRDAGLVAGSDPVGALALRSPGAPPAYDAPGDAAALEAQLTARGLFSSPKWTSTKELSTHRGIIGEVSRIAAIEPTLGPGQSVVQGILVMESPPALWAISSPAEAKAWAAANGIEPAWLSKHTGPDGVLHFGVIKTEIDAAVFQGQPDGTLAPVRFENVKAGIGSATKAREQNAIAADNWANASMRYLFPDGKGGHHIPALDRSAEAASRIVSKTVGPSDDPRYDVHLPLSMHDITLLSELHP